ncbi:MAG: DUF2339 domain-containing protein [Dechloromonas sp.]|nr:DUF2339 domain-containing protein [Dechloromonas sp.]
MRAIIAGALVGLLLGSAIGGEFSVLGAIAGALVGGYFFRSRQPARMTSGELEQRLLELEKNLAEQRSQLEMLRRLVTPGESIAAPPITPTAEPAPPPSATTARDTTVSLPVPGQDPWGRWVDLDALLEPRKPSSGSGAEAPRSEPETANARPDPMAAYLKATLGIDGDRLAVPGWLKWFWETNPLAKIGIVLLFFGVASGLRLAIDHGLLPVPVRLIATAVAGIGLIALGMAKARVARHRVFGLALQGGGFALLYLIGYFMLTRYTMIGQGLAFAAFAALGVGCLALAARQDGPALAVFGLSGAFLAPVLAGGNTQTPLPLFLYFTLLNAFILGVDWFRAWRVLNIAGFVFTLAVGMAWAIGNYHPPHYLVTQAFVVLFLAAYSAMPVATALFRAPGSAGWQDGMLLFGTPLVGCFLQAQLVGDTAYGLAWSALAGSLWYFMLWGLIVRRAGSGPPVIAYAHFGIAAFLATIAVPLAFDAQVTSAFWAAEGAAVLWFGVRTRRAIAQGTGLLMQLAAGAALLLGWPALHQGLPVANDAVLGAAIVVTAGLFSTRVLRRIEGATPVPSELPLGWAALWWFATGFAEISRCAPWALQPSYHLLFVAASVVAVDGLSMLWRWPQLRAASLLLTVAAVLAAFVTVVRAGHPFAGFMAFALPLALVLHQMLLAADEKRGNPFFQPVRHVGGWWLLLASLVLEAAWQAEHHAQPPHFWAFVAVTTLLAASIALVAWGKKRGLWPFAVAEARYVPLGVFPALAGLVVLLPLGNVTLSGSDGLNWPYLPLFNAFDATQLAAAASLLLLAGLLKPEERRVLRGVVVAIAFVWLSALAARIAHHWGGVPFAAGPLLRSTLFHALLTLLWTVTAIATLILASRRGLRMVWFGGITLLGIVGAKLLLFDATGRGTLTWAATLIGVALLVLAAGYFAPLPPEERGSPRGEDE